jgi:hypothetical protein
MTKPNFNITEFLDGYDFERSTKILGQLAFAQKSRYISLIKDCLNKNKKADNYFFVSTILEMEKLNDETLEIFDKDSKKLDNFLIDSNSEKFYPIIIQLESTCLYIREYGFDFENEDPYEGMPEKEFINSLQTALLKMEEIIEK